MLRAANLFLGVNTKYTRPSAMPQILDPYTPLFEAIRQRAGHDRVHISPNLRLSPALTTKHRDAAALAPAHVDAVEP
ncbi:MAG: hypothetical protein ABSA52_19810 [Candidatus Binatia bacterium]